MDFLSAQSSIVINLKAKKGFSLIELLVAMALFSSGLLSIISLQIQAQEVLGDSLYKTQALIFASSRHEIHHLAAKDNSSAIKLSEEWKSQVLQELPEARIQSTKIGKTNFVINLMWLKSHISNGCNIIKDKSLGCLQL
jgi:prepilin-type N-terminal cleavage/methylation domain-containing protein